jgi:predicted nucleic acid-binding protein
MIAAIDTNIILDILIPNEPFCASSQKLLEGYLSKGKLIICEIVLAELAAQFPSEEDLNQFLFETGIRLEYSGKKSLYLAGARWAKYIKKNSKNLFNCSRCGQEFEFYCPRCRSVVTRRQHVLGDFLIAAHALERAECLLSRDLGIYKTYFSNLRVIGSI